MSEPLPDLFKAMARRRLAERGNETIKKAFWFVRPIFWPDERGNAELIGSCVLFVVNGRHFLISAAHVLDRTTQRTCYVGGKQILLEIEGQRKTTKPPAGNRDRDKIDLGFLEISTQLVEGLEGCAFLTPDEVDVNDVAALGQIQSTHSYIAFGYPASKTKTRSPEPVIIPEPIAYSGRSLHHASYELIGAAEYSHVLMEFDRKKSIDVYGPRTAPDPHGMSGGALLRFDSLTQTSDTLNPLVGILIEYHKKDVKGILATRISLCMAAMSGLFPELRDALPQPGRVTVNTKLE